MAKITISIDINTPQGVTAAEAVRLFSNYYEYKEKLFELQENGEYAEVDNPETRAVFSKRIIANKVRNVIYAQRLREAKEAVSVPNDIAVE